MNVFGRHQQAANDQYKATRPQMPPNNLYMETPTTKSTADTDAAHDDNMSTERKESPWTDSKSTNLDDIIRIMSEIDAVETLPMPLPPPNPDLGKMVTKKQLLQRDDWEEWRQLCHKQLDQYNSQGMFSEPITLPTNSSASYMHWTYTYKFCGTKKARMVCDGARNRSATTLGHTYANSLDAPSERLFWALVANEILLP
jgi:hypothetical protein